MLPAIDFDGPWKEFLDDYLPEIMAFCFPDAHADIDWSRGYTRWIPCCSKSPRPMRPASKRSTN
ncbi:MAG: hypothetical protein U0232_30830 [Thermomicrobiales bacterium]